MGSLVSFSLVVLLNPGIVQENNGSLSNNFCYDDKEKHCFCYKNAWNFDCSDIFM